RQLKLAIVDFELGRDRLALRRADLQAAVQRDLRSGERLGQFRTLLAFVRSLCGDKQRRGQSEDACCQDQTRKFAFHGYLLPKCTWVTRLVTRNLPPSRCRALS